MGLSDETLPLSGSIRHAHNQIYVKNIYYYIFNNFVYVKRRNHIDK